MKKSKQASNNLSESERILKRVSEESEVLGNSSFSRVANKVNDHMSAKDADETDPIEVLGTRIGRALAVIFFVFLVVYLFTTYVMK